MDYEYRVIIVNGNDLQRILYTYITFVARMVKVFFSVFSSQILSSIMNSQENEYDCVFQTNA